jgi:hypothetical protein
MFRIIETNIFPDDLEVPMTYYTPALKECMDLAFQNGTLCEGSTWKFLFHAANIYVRIYENGRYAEFLPEVNAEARQIDRKYTSHADSALVQVLQSYYENPLIEDRYLNGADWKLGLARPEDCRLCPKTGHRVKPITVAPSVVAALEKIWQVNYRRPFYEGGLVERYGKMEHAQCPGWMLPDLMACLMRISWHLTAEGVPGVTSFDDRWDEVKAWQEDHLGARILRDFWVPTLWSENFDIQPYMAKEEKRRLYFDAWEYLNQLEGLDQTFAKRPKDSPKLQVAKKIVESHDSWVSLASLHPEYYAGKGPDFDEEFLKPFRDYLKEQS